MAIENKYFYGGLNTDDEDRLIPNGDYRYALNIRNSKSDNDSQGAIENVKGNTLVSFTLGNGDFKTIGAYDYQEGNKVYYFVWSGQKNHKILEYDYNVNTISTVLSTPLLNFQQDKLILPSNVVVVNGLLKFTDAHNEPFSINIERAKNNSYPSPFKLEYIKAIVPPPIKPLIANYQTDVNTKTNNLRNKLFQFRYKYIYEDNEESAWSPISKVPLPLSEAAFRPYSYFQNKENNVLRLTIETGSELVKAIKIAAREGNTGDFFLVKRLDKDTLSLPSNNTYDYDFYNNETYISLDNEGSSGMRLFDNVPYKANTQSLIAGNRLAYAGIEEGQDPVPINIDIEQKFSSVQKTTPPNVTIGFNSQNIYTNFWWIGTTNGGTSFSTTNLFSGVYTFGQYVNLAPIPTFPNPTFQFLNGVITYTSFTPNFNLSVNGNIYYLKRFGQHGITSYSANAAERNITYFGTDPTGINTWSKITTHRMVQEYILDNPNGVAGLRYLLNINVNYFNYALNRNETKRIQFQYTTVAGDTLSQVASGFTSQLNSYSYKSNDNGVEIKLKGVSGSWSFSQGGNVSSNQIVLCFYADAYCPNDSITSNGWNITPPALYDVNSSLQVLADWTTKVFKSLKNGAEHGIGIVYYEGANRSGLTNISNEKQFYVSYPTERNIPNGHYITNTELEVTINHFAPRWATHYQFVYTGNQTVEYLPADGYKGFIQTTIRDVAPSYITGALKGKLTSLSEFNSKTPEAVGLVYGYSKGDRIRFIQDPNGNYYTTLPDNYVDVEVISYDQSTSEIVFKDPQVSIATESIIEIYTPKSKTEDSFYWEIGEVYEIVNGFHKGNIQDQVGSIPAKVLLEDIGDVYLRYRTFPIDRQIEDYNFSDYYKSDSWDKGRPNIVDDNIKRIFRPTTVRYSNPYIWETNINGLSTFDDFDFESYDQNYGEIKLTHPEDKTLILFQQRKVGVIGINQSVLYGDDGEVVSTLTNESKVLSKSIRYYAGEYGIGNNPESFSVYGNNKYFADVKRGAFLRLGANGIVPISEYKMHNYFNDIFSLIDNQQAKYFVKSFYDIRFGEVVVHITNDIYTIVEDVVSPPIESSPISTLRSVSSLDFQTIGESISPIINLNTTTPTTVVNDMIAFSEEKNRWVTHYKYNPDFVSEYGIGLIAFKGGQLYIQNNNTLYNNFFGVQEESIIEFLSNIEPERIKFYNNINVKATSPFSMPLASNQYGQETSLETTDFDDDEGVYKAAILRDINTPNVALPLIEGDEIRCHSLKIKLQSDDTALVKLFGVGIGLGVSELTNR